MVVADLTREQIFDWLADVPDPEIPVLSITDLGIVRDIEVGDEVCVSLSPTYSGCPATEVIEQSVVNTWRHRGLDNLRITRSLGFLDFCLFRFVSCSFDDIHFDSPPCEVVHEPPVKHEGIDIHAH